MEKFEQFGEFFANLLQRQRRISEQVTLRAPGSFRGCLARPGRGVARARIQIFPCAFDGVAFIVKQPLDLQHQLHIFAAIQPMTFAGFLWAQRGKLRFPEPQNVRFNSREAAHFADAKIKLVGDLGAAFF